MTVDHRLARLASVWSNRPTRDADPSEPTRDFSALTPREMFELDELLRLTEVHERSWRRGRALTAVERARLAELRSRGRYPDEPV